jgi:hypothetical protein
MVCENIVVLSQEESGYRTKELSRDGDYKIMQMYLQDDNNNFSRRITFELPVEWIGSSCVFTFTDENGRFAFKLDIYDAINATREEVFNNFNNYANIDIESVVEVFEENIYSTETHEVFYRKFLSAYNQTVIVHFYYLYANGVRMGLVGMVYVEDKPEYDDIFKRIAESVRFQFNVDEVTTSPATNDNILIYIVLLFVSAILVKIISKLPYQQIKKPS